MVGYHCGVGRNGPRLDMGSKHGLGVVKFVPFHFRSASNNAPFRRPPGARVDTINFISMYFFHLHLDDYVFTPGHLAEKWSWSEPTTEWEQVESTLRRCNLSPEKLKKKQGVSGLLGIFLFYKETHYSNNQPSRYLVTFCFHMLQEGLWDFFLTSRDDFIIDSLSRLW